MFGPWCAGLKPDLTKGAGAQLSLAGPCFLSANWATARPVARVVEGVLDATADERGR